MLPRLRYNIKSYLHLNTYNLRRPPLIPHRPSYSTPAAAVAAKTESAKTESAKTKKTEETVPRNSFQVQLLSPCLHTQTFGQNPLPADTFVERRNNIAIKHLARQGIEDTFVEPTPNLELQLPKLSAGTIEEHFYRIGVEVAEPYLTKAKEFAETSLPPLPAKWVMKSGWMCYKTATEPEEVSYPPDDCITFDVEVLVSDGPWPTLAVAASSDAWYLWCSPTLADVETKTVHPRHLIPLGKVPDRVIVGHNVGYDRARVLEEYHCKKTSNRYVDTMSLHIAVSGLCSQQRPRWQLDHKIAQRKAAEEASGKAENVENEIFRELDELSAFYDVSSMNGLKDVVQFYCKKELDKSQRDWFVKGTMEDIREHFDELAGYCALDVFWTHEVYKTVLPRFFHSCPHPVSFAGILHMGNSFLTVDESWEDFIHRCRDVHRSREDKVLENLRLLAEEAITRWETDPAEVTSDKWLGQLDWSVKPRARILKGKPEWYRDLWDNKAGELKLSVRLRIAPILLRLRWQGFVLFHDSEHGWCYRIPVTAEKDYSPKTVRFRDPDTEELCARIPHKDGDEARCGNPIGKTYLQYFEDNVLTSEYEIAKEALELNASSAYWVVARERIENQFVVWDAGSTEVLDLGLPKREKKTAVETKMEDGMEAGVLEETTVETKMEGVTKSTTPRNGIILPQIITMGAVTRRAVERTWMTASNAKLNRVGSELKAMVHAPQGYRIVGADVDSEELWISSILGDAQFGSHGATALGWMTLQGTKAQGTDLHSKTAQILGIGRNKAKVFNYARIYGAGVAHAARLLMQYGPELTPEEAQKKAQTLYRSTKGVRTYRRNLMKRSFWHGGSESYMFNALEEIAFSKDPRTPVLGCKITAALHTDLYQGQEASEYLPSRVNWVVQSSGVDYLHLLIVSMEHLIKRYGIDARFMLSVHDEVRYLAKEEDKYRAALALQVANLWTRCLFSWRLGIRNLPQSVAFFSAVDIDTVLRKETDMNCLTPSNPVKIPNGISLTIDDLIQKFDGVSPEECYLGTDRYLGPNGYHNPTSVPPIKSTKPAKVIQAIPMLRNLNILEAQTMTKDEFRVQNGGVSVRVVIMPAEDVPKKEKVGVVMKEKIKEEKADIVKMQVDVVQTKIAEERADIVKMQVDAVQTEKIAEEKVDIVKMQVDTVQTEKIVEEKVDVVQTEKAAEERVDIVKVLVDAVQPKEKVAEERVDIVKMQVDAVQTEKAAEEREDIVKVPVDAVQTKEKAAEDKANIVKVPVDAVQTEKATEEKVDAVQTEKDTKPKKKTKAAEERVDVMQTEKDTKPKKKAKATKERVDVMQTEKDTKPKKKAKVDAMQTEKDTKPKKKAKATEKRVDAMQTEKDTKPKKKAKAAEERVDAMQTEKDTKPKKKAKAAEERVDAMQTEKDTKPKKKTKAAEERVDAMQTEKDTKPKKKAKAAEEKVGKEIRNEIMHDNVTAYIPVVSNLDDWTPERTTRIHSDEDDMLETCIVVNSPSSPHPAQHLKQ
ncbi:DNA polymerase family A-domain-containing protein [Jimgerdemannia flammicorona]|uniref:DNA-directed DNA polymerase n=1 Tax=Jimgerdemannia flammicorona TaxID=994334 RepID=A0A433QPP9_9FUNG|nr:DNA polymerase family A-domain-containing protein [Jimgerdemannia flammicorona]